MVSGPGWFKWWKTKLEVETLIGLSLYIRVLRSQNY